MSRLLRHSPRLGRLSGPFSVFPGIGLVAVAASGWVTTNTLAPIKSHLDLL